MTFRWVLIYYCLINFFFECLFRQMGNWSGNGFAKETPIHYVLIDVDGEVLEETKKVFTDAYQSVRAELNIPRSTWFFQTVLLDDCNDPTELVNVSKFFQGKNFFRYGLYLKFKQFLFHYIETVQSKKGSCKNICQFTKIISAAY